jgi:hypothetical protein
VTSMDLEDVTDLGGDDMMMMMMRMMMMLMIRMTMIIMIIMRKCFMPVSLCVYDACWRDRTAR